MKREALAANSLRYLPANESHYSLLCFDETYMYYYIHMNLLPFCSGSPAPLIRIILRMVITFENDNIVIIYVLENIISYARANRYISIDQCVWWLASSIGLQEGLVMDINNLRIQLKAYQAPIATSLYITGIHPNPLPQIS
jgi:hypothetical protein